MNNPSIQPPSKPSHPGLVVFAWLFVSIPLLWGVSQTIMKAMALFH